MSMRDYAVEGWLNGHGRRAVVIGGFCFIATLAALVALAAGPAQARSSRPARGILTLRLAGLPRGAEARLTLLGPPQSPHSKARLHRHLTLGSVRKLQLRAGHYRLRLPKVRLRHGKGRIDAGAVASPVRRVLRVTVRADRQRKLDIRYGTIINPGVRGVSGRIVRILGDPLSPSGLVLRPGTAVRPGQVLSAEPSASLPRGLLATVGSVERARGGPVVSLTPEDIYDVAPNISFDIPLSSDEGAKLSRFAQCKAGQITPFAHVGDFHLSGRWTTTRVLFTDVKSGAEVQLRYKVSAGVGVNARLGVSCSLSLPEVGIQGMAGPIPVYGGFRPTASAELGAAATLQASGSVQVTTGAKIGGIPPTASPIVNFSSPQFELSAQLFAGLEASIGLDAEIGIGVANAANIHASVGNDLDFTAAPGHCGWDLELGKFSATGEVGPFSISTPSTPPLYRRNLWQAACGAPPAPPPPPPAPALPLTRAAMSWDTDSDVDLYGWDESGRQAYYVEPFAIPSALLVHDVIPLTGEYSHAPELFQETASPGRRYTFGVCDFRGEGAEVTLEVHDPSGGVRTFHTTLFEPGDSAVLASSPEGGGYIPPPGWCHYVE
ncbi:MAG: hypothetical protein ACOYD4_04310 [Solirubrobacterales bacterium]